MAAILTAFVKIKDMEKMGDYAEKAVPTMLAHGCEPLFRVPVSKVLKGEADYTMLGAFRFPDTAAVDAWWNSEEYVALHDLREAAADVTFVVHEDG